MAASHGHGPRSSSRSRLFSRTPSASPSRRLSITSRTSTNPATHASSRSWLHGIGRGTFRDTGGGSLKLRAVCTVLITHGSGWSWTRLISGINSGVLCFGSHALSCVCAGSMRAYAVCVRFHQVGGLPGGTTAGSSATSTRP
eukprot:3157691-Prymnesium_polylepis.1